jgi:hypothetical protein
MEEPKENRAQRKNRGAAKDDHVASPIQEGNLLTAQLTMLESVNWSTIVHA